MQCVCVHIHMKQEEKGEKEEKWIGTLLNHIENSAKFRGGSVIAEWFTLYATTLNKTVKLDQ